MAITVLSRWKGSYEQALPILREASPLMKEAGATSVMAGVCLAGPETDLIYTASTYPDLATYERSRGNAGFRRVYAEFLKVVQVQDRSIIVSEEL